MAKPGVPLPLRDRQDILRLKRETNLSMNAIAKELRLAYSTVKRVLKGAK